MITGCCFIRNLSDSRIEFLKPLLHANPFVQTPDTCRCVINDPFTDCIYRQNVVFMCTM